MRRLLVAGFALFALGAAFGVVLVRHDDVVRDRSGQLCDRSPGFFSECYRLAADQLVPPPDAIPTAPPATGGCFGFCEPGDIPRPPGVPEVDAWTTGGCDTLVLTVGGSLSATPGGYLLLGAPLLALLGASFVAVALARFRAARPVFGSQRLAVGAGYLALAAASLSVAPNWLFGGDIWSRVVNGGSAMTVASLMFAALTLLIARRRSSRAAAWAEPVAAAGALGVVIVAVVLFVWFHVVSFGC